MEKPCLECGKPIKCKPSNLEKKIYCSKLCMAIGYKKRMKGKDNPNFKSSGTKICRTCNCKFHSYDKKRKFCSMKCAGLSPENIAKAALAALKPRKKREKRGTRCICKICGINFWNKHKTKYCESHKSEAKAAQCSGIKNKNIKTTKITGKCEYCGNEIKYYPSRLRKFCSYECHIKSGGAIRAGKAAGTMTRKYGAKKDANHVEIVMAFKKLGMAVLDLSSMGSGCPDLLVMCKGTTYLVDVKNPNTGYGKRGLNPRQKEWAIEWKGGPVYLISTVEQVLDMANGNLGNLKKFPE